MARLTDASVRSLPLPAHGQKAYRDDTLPGFAVRVSQGGTKTFALMVGKDRQLITIGRYPVISLQDARTEAKRLLAERTLGKHRPTRLSFTDALALFVAEKEQKNRTRTIDENKRLLTKYFPSVQKKAVADITTDDITRQLDKLRSTPGTALHAFWAMRLFMRWCVKRRYIQHSPIDGLDAPSPTKFRDRVLSDDELRAVWRATDDDTFGKIVRVLMTTGQRRGEIGALQADWIGENTITIPAHISKNRRQHTFPIGSLTKAIIQPANFSGWSKSKARLDKVANIAPWTLHDLRRSYATNLHALGIRTEVVEALLNHVSGVSRAGISGVYNRHRYEAEMREAVTTYEEWFTRTILPQKEEG